MMIRKTIKPGQQRPARPIPEVRQAAVREGMARMITLLRRAVDLGECLDGRPCVLCLRHVGRGRRLYTDFILHWREDPDTGGALFSTQAVPMGHPDGLPFLCGRCFRSLRDPEQAFRDLMRHHGFDWN
jgi:hypothetical protein